MNEEREFLEKNPDAEFIGVVQVGNRGLKRFFTDKEAYKNYRDKAWDSGHDMYCGIIKGKL